MRALRDAARGCWHSWRSRWILAGRSFLALVFLAGATYNALVTLRAPVTELGRLIALSPTSAVRDLASRVAMRQPIAFVLTVILFESSVAASMLLGVRLRRRGYVASLLFFLVLLPLIGWYALTNIVWAIPAALLLRYDERSG